MEFKHPFLFALILILPVLYFLSKKRNRIFLPFSDTGLFGASQPFSFRIFLYKTLPFLRALVIILFIAALARPQKVTAEREHLTKGVDIVISLDISGSMLAEDFKPVNRLEVAKREINNFIDHRENDRVGLVVFARQAFTQCPLTADYGVLKSLVEQIHIGMIPDGTAIGMGLATAVNRLRASEAKSKVILLISDGANNAGKIDPVTAAELAKSFDMRVHTILIGKEGLVPFPVEDPLFGKRYVQANIEVDPMLMKRIADITGGTFHWAHTPEELSSVYEQIDKLETSEIKVKEYRSYEEFFHIFLIPALILLFFEISLSQLVVQKVP